MTLDPGFIGPGLIVVGGLIEYVGASKLRGSPKVRPAADKIMTAEVVLMVFETEQQLPLDFTDVMQQLDKLA